MPAMKPTLDMWQGGEIEYGVPFKAPGLTYVNDLLDALGEYRFSGDFSGPAFLFNRKGNPCQFLRNGGRAYGDIGTRPGIYDIFEITTPECRNALELVAYDKASEIYAYLASRRLEEKIGKRVHIYKTSITMAEPESRKYATRGTHENYLTERSLFAEKTDLLIPFLTCRQLFCGAGGYYRGQFVLSPRQMFVRGLYSKEIFEVWPMISTRDEPLAGTKYYRCQVVNGEGTRSQLTTFLRHSITSYVILGIERGFIQNVPKLRDPVAETRRISKNVAGDWKVTLENGERMDAIEYLESYYIAPIEALLEEGETKDHDRLAFNELKDISTKLEEGRFEGLDKRVEWAIKLGLIEERVDDFFEFESGISDEEKREAANFQYMAVTESLFDELEEELGIRRVVSDESISEAVFQPPRGSRAELRVTLASRFRDRLDDISWEGVTIAGKQFLYSVLDGWDWKKIEKEVKIVRDSI